MSYTEIDDDLKEVIVELKQMDNNHSKCYKEIQQTLDDKVDQFYLATTFKMP